MMSMNKPPAQGNFVMNVIMLKKPAFVEDYIDTGTE
jgi:hypothetical protein